MHWYLNIYYGGNKAVNPSIIISTLAIVMEIANINGTKSEHSSCIKTILIYLKIVYIIN